MRNHHPHASRQRARSVRSAAVWVAAFTLVGSAMAPTSPVAASARGSAGIFGRGDQPLVGYRALRRMHAFTDKAKHEAWLDAWTELKDGQFSYQIVSERGSEA